MRLARQQWMMWQEGGKLKSRTDTRRHRGWAGGAAISANFALLAFTNTASLTSTSEQDSHEIVQ